MQYTQEKRKQALPLPKRLYAVYEIPIIKIITSWL